MEKEVLQQILQEIQELKQGQEEMKTDISELKQGQLEIKKQMGNFETKLDNVLDTVKTMAEEMEIQKDKVMYLSDKFVEHETRLKKLKQ